MFLQKLMTSVALSSIITPSALQTTHLTNQKIQANQELISAKSSVNGLIPFNPATLKFHKMDQYGNYYAYYGDGAFPPPQVPGQVEYVSTFGFVLRVATSFTKSFQDAYQYGRNHGMFFDGLGDMISYVTDDVFYQSPYSAKWPLCQYFIDNTNAWKRHAVTMSFVETTNVINFMNLAYKDQSAVDLLFFVVYVQELKPYIETPFAVIGGKIILVNEVARTTLTTKTVSFHYDD